MQEATPPVLPPDLGKEVDLFIHRVFDRLVRSRMDRAYDVALLFLFLRKEGILQEFPASTRHTNVLDDLERNVRTSTTDQEIKLVFEELIGPVRHFETYILFELVNEFSKLPDNFFGEHYPAIVERILLVISTQEGKKGGGYDQPYAITDLILRMANVPPGGTVYNPFAGTASIGSFLRKDVRYRGQELNMRTWALGEIRLRAHQPDGKAALFRENSLLEWDRSGSPYDLIVANPPFNLRVEDSAHELFGTTTVVECVFLLRALADHSANGKVICVLPLGFLTSTQRDRSFVKERLLDSGALDTIVELPGGLLNYTSIPIAIVLLDKARDPKAPIRMVDATQQFTSVSRAARTLDVPLIWNAIQLDTRADFVRHVSVEEIRTNGNNLLPRRYFAGPGDGGGETPLKDLVTVLRRERVVPGTTAPFVRIRDLHEDPMDHVLRANGLEVTEIPAGAWMLDRTALLVALRWSNLKPTWFTYTGIPVAVTSDILALDINEAQVEAPYLVHELLTPQVQAQVAAMNRGVTIPSLRREDVLAICVRMPSLPEQRAKVQGLKEAQVAAQLEHAKLMAERHGVELQAFGNSVSFKHRLGTPLLAVGSGIDTLKISLDRMQPSWRDQIVSAREQLTLGAVMQNVTYELQRISAMLDADSLELDVTKYPLQQMDLVAYAKQATRKAQALMNGGHEVSFSISLDIKDQLNGKAPFLGNRALLDIALDALVDNAQRHGFAHDPGPHKLDIRIGMRMENKQTWVVLTIANSGRPFPEGFGLDRYIRKNVHAGPTGHTGIGGHHVHEIAQHHKGMLDMVTAPKLLGLYATEIDLLFPLAL